uniref:Receptor ligand binding region domain-containing protein n=1 Tax=Periophthalmus magnuspinnatus TaxID=409849 RepID=A0A3B4AK72_9GOBI
MLSYPSLNSLLPAKLFNWTPEAQYAFEKLKDLFISNPTSALPPVCRGAAILDEQASWCGRGERGALTLARESVNEQLQGSARGRVEVDIFDLQRDSQYHTTETMCQILPKGVVSVIGPASSPASGSTVSHICGEKEIPHVKIGPEETPKLPYLRFASVTLYPSNEDLSQAISSVLSSFGSPTTSLICAKAECLLRLEELVRHFLISRETLSVRMLDESQDPTSLLKEIRDDKVAMIIIDANASTSYSVLRKVHHLSPDSLCSRSLYHLFCHRAYSSHITRCGTCSSSCRRGGRRGTSRSSRRSSWEL